MTTIDPSVVAAEVRARGWLDGPFPDDDLDDLQRDLALAADLLHAQLDFGAYPPSIVDLDDFTAVLAGVHHALAALAHLDRFIGRRRRAIEAQGVDWDRHVYDVREWREDQREKRAERRGAA